MSDLEGENIKICKVVLIGESGVGKTSVISRFVNNSFDNEVISTTGASYAVKILTFDEYQGKSVKYEIWDTAGQEKYRGLTKIFYKDAKIAILIYDITNAKSYEELKNYWVNQLQENGPKDIIIGIAGNKCDLFEEEEVPEMDAREFSNKIGAFYHLTSASASIGINDLFYELGKKFLDPGYTRNNIDTKDMKGAGEEGKDGGQNKEEVHEEREKGVKLKKDSADDKKKEKKKCC